MPFTNTTLATLQARLIERYDGQVFWTADQARRAINEGLRIFNAITGVWRGSTALITIPNDHFLFVGGALVKGTRVSMGGRILAPSSLYGLDYGIGNWERATVATGGDHPSQVVYWAPVGLTEIAIYPAEVANLPILIEGVRSTTILVNPGDFLDLGDEEIDTLLGYALHVLSFAKGITAIEKTKPLLIAFYKAAAKRNAVFEASSLYRRLIGLDKTRITRPIEMPAPPDPQPAGG